jgi:hypothetical protein
MPRIGDHKLSTADRVCYAVIFIVWLVAVFCMEGK